MTSCSRRGCSRRTSAPRATARTQALKGELMQLLKPNPTIDNAADQAQLYAAAKLIANRAVPELGQEQAKLEILRTRGRRDRAPTPGGPRRLQPRGRARGPR